jgi:hypothetical protein
MKRAQTWLYLMATRWCLLCERNAAAELIAQELPDLIHHLLGLPPLL